MGYRRVILPIALAALFISSGSTFGQAVPTVILKTELSQSTAHVGDTITATVSATVMGGGSGDGLTAYDVDFYPLNSGINFVGTANLPADNLVSAGTPDAPTGGLLGITGIYDSPGVAIGSETQLFTVQVHADAVGENSVSAGLSVYPNGTGVPFILDASGDYVDPSSGDKVNFLVDSSQAVAQLDVLPGQVPEPASGLLLAGSLAACVLRRYGRKARR